MAMTKEVYDALSKMLGNELETLTLLAAPEPRVRQAYFMSFVLDSSGHGMFCGYGNISDPNRCLQVVAKMRERADLLEAAALKALA